MHCDGFVLYDTLKEIFGVGYRISLVVDRLHQKMQCHFECRRVDEDIRVPQSVYM